MVASLIRAARAFMVAGLVEFDMMSLDSLTNVVVATLVRVVGLVQVIVVTSDRCPSTPATLLINVVDLFTPQVV